MRGVRLMSVMIVSCGFIRSFCVFAPLCRVQFAEEAPSLDLDDGGSDVKADEYVVSACTCAMFVLCVCSRVCVSAAAAAMTHPALRVSVLLAVSRLLTGTCTCRRCGQCLHCDVDV